MTLDRRGLVLLVLLTVAWGVNWPVMKLGVAHFPPLAFRLLCMAGGVVALGLALWLRGESLRLPRRDWGPRCAWPLPNMVIWHLFAICAVSFVVVRARCHPRLHHADLGGAVGLLLFRDRLAAPAWAGIACALSASPLLLSGELATLTGSPAGTLLMLLAAAGWGYGTQLMKRSTLALPVGVLTFWMLVCTLPFLLAGTLLLESGWRLPDAVEWAAIAYNAVVVFAYCHLVWFSLARSLPPAVFSLSVMFIPVVGVFSGMWMLGEQPHWQDYAAVALMLAALASVLLVPLLARVAEAGSDATAYAPRFHLTSPHALGYTRAHP